MLRLAAPAFAIAALIAVQQARAQVGPESLEGFQLPPGEDAQPAVQGPVAPNTPPPRCPDTEAMQAMEPDLRLRMCGITACERFKIPLRLTSSTRSQFSPEISMIFKGWVMPALLISTSICPNVAST